MPMIGPKCPDVTISVAEDGIAVTYTDSANRHMLCDRGDFDKEDLGIVVAYMVTCVYELAPYLHMSFPDEESDPVEITIHHIDGGFAFTILSLLTISVSGFTIGEITEALKLKSERLNADIEKRESVDG